MRQGRAGAGVVYLTNRGRGLPGRAGQGQRQGQGRAGVGAG